MCVGVLMRLCIHVCVVCAGVGACMCVNDVFCVYACVLVDGCIYVCLCV